MEELVNKIKKHYSSFLNVLSEDELNNFNKTADPILIKRIVNKIWQIYLTNPLNYSEGESFRFLMEPHTFAWDSKNISDYFDSTHELFLITDRNIKDIPKYSGIIVSPNWTTSDKILLPIDFNKKETIRAEVNPIAIADINIGEDNINSLYDTAKLMATEVKLPFVSINKRLNPDYKLTKQDYLDISKEIITLYVFKYLGKRDLVLINFYYANYRNNIINIYKKMIKNNTFTPNAFMNASFTFLSKIEVKDNENGLSK